MRDARFASQLSHHDMQFSQLNDGSPCDSTYESQAFPYQHVTPEVFAKMDNYQVSESTNISDWSSREYWSDDNSNWTHEIPQTFNMWQGAMSQLQNPRSISAVPIDAIQSAVERGNIQQQLYAGDARNVSPVYSVPPSGFQYHNNSAYVQS